MSQPVQENAQRDEKTYRAVDGMVRATVYAGPVGTGCYLVGGRGPWSEPREVEVWLTALSIPLLPLGRWQVSASGEGEGRAGDEALELTVHSRTRLPLRTVVWRLARAALAAALVALPLAFWAASVGRDWATTFLEWLGINRLLTALLGSGLGGRLFGALAMATDISVLLAGVMIPTLVMLDLDGHRPRVPLRSAWRGADEPRPTPQAESDVASSTGATA
jgi:hypothetical protein